MNSRVQDDNNGGSLPFILKVLIPPTSIRITIRTIIKNNKQKCFWKDILAEIFRIYRVRIIKSDIMLSENTSLKLLRFD
jgi:hypothetical protein